jgi:hypothetical protein
MKVIFKNGKPQATVADDYTAQDGEAVIAADPVMTPETAFDWQYINGAWVQPEPINPRILTPLQFRQRLTLNERVALDGFEGSALPAQAKAMLRTLLADLAVAKDVDLDSPSTRQGLQFIEDVGILAAGRAAEIVG